MILAVVTLALAPWTGHDLPASTTQAQAKYRLTVSAPANSNVHLTTKNVASGWIAAFCNGRVCAPNEVNQAIGPNGKAVIEFSLIREEDRAPKKSGATILSDDGATISVKPR